MEMPALIHTAVNPLQICSLMKDYLQFVSNKLNTPFENLSGVRTLMRHDIMAKPLHSEIIGASLHIYALSHQKEFSARLQEICSAITHLNRAHFDAHEIQIIHSLQRFNAYQMGYLCGIEHRVCKFMGEHQYITNRDIALEAEKSIFFKTFDPPAKDAAIGDTISPRESFYRQAIPLAGHIENYSNLVSHAMKNIS